jgi:putative addiction module component (TIGR02574 family)
MAVSKKQIVEQALALPARDREMLAEELWLSLDGATKEQVHDEWATEIARRLKQLDRGEVDTIPADEVMREARKLVRKKRRS